MNIKPLYFLLIFIQCMTINLNAECTNPKLTRPIVIDIFCSLTTCCEELKVKFHDSCSPTFIRQTDVGTSGFTITTPGLYALGENINFAPGSPATAIIIDSDDVTIDLACFILAQTNLTSAVNGIRVLSDRTNITIKNGLIDDFTGDGINVENGASIIACDNITIRACDRGLVLDGTSINPIIDVKLTGLDLKSNSTGVAYYFTQLGLIKKCNALFNTQAGYDIRTSFSNHFIGCLARNTTSNSGNAYGFFVNDGGQNIFESLNIKDISTNSTFTGDTATGFFIGPDENELTLKHSQVHNCVTTSSAQPFGIQMDYGLPSSITAVSNFVHGATLQSTAWTSDGRYLAIGGSGGSGGFEVRVLEFDGVTLLPVANFEHGATVMSVAWSPDGKYLAIGGLGGTGVGTPEVRILLFNGTSLTSIANFDHGATIQSVAWSPDGRYVAIGGVRASAVQVRIFEFTGSSLVQRASFSPGIVPIIFTVTWSPTGKYLAIGGDPATGSGVTTTVLNFNGTSVSVAATFSIGSTVNSLDWSLNERYLASGGFTGADTNQVRIFQFTGISLIPVANFAGGPPAVNSVSWSPDARFLAIGAVTAAAQARILQFTGTALSVAKTFNNGATVFEVSWSPNGAYIALAAAGTFTSRVLTAFEFPQQCTILDNVITNINAVPATPPLPWIADGRGLSASSAKNLIIDNTAFDNDINFVFVTDVFQQFLVNVKSEVPSIIENLSFPPL